MSRHVLKIEKLNECYQLKIDIENPYVNIMRIDFNPLEKEKKYPSLKLTIRIGHFDGSESIHPMFLSTVEKNSSFKINFSKSIDNFKSIEITIDDSNKEHLKDVSDYENLRLVYEIIALLDNTVPTNGFQEHLNDPRNIKILFSAPFGKGKSTFLDYFFEEKANQYKVFKIHPVNYAVAKNEDIFTYIKCELLMQLLNSGVPFDKQSTSKTSAFGEFFKKNAHKLLAPLLLLSPSLGQNMYQMFEKFDALKDEFIAYHEKLNTNEAVLTENFLTEFINKEGGIFEDNFITHLIRKYIDRIKETENKEVILLIDDLDRMDPDHIFRILNVFSAHYDTYKFRNQEEHNKFNFDRIILVADYDNLNSIYSYRYGPKANFEGYINKYYSTRKFNYNNDKVNEAIIKNIDGFQSLNDVTNNPMYRKFMLVASGLMNAGQLSLRELIKLQSIKMYKLKDKLHNGSFRSHSYFKYGCYSPTIMLLSELGSPEILIKKMGELEEEHIVLKINYDTDFWILYGARAFSQSQTLVKYFWSDFYYEYSLSVDGHFDLTSFDENGIVKNAKTGSQANEVWRPHFGFLDWKRELIENVKFYRTIQDRI